MNGSIQHRCCWCKSIFLLNLYVVLTCVCACACSWKLDIKHVHGRQPGHQQMCAHSTPLLLHVTLQSLFSMMQQQSAIGHGMGVTINQHTTPDNTGTYALQMTCCHQAPAVWKTYEKRESCKGRITASYTPSPAVLWQMCCCKCPHRAFMKLWDQLLPAERDTSIPGHEKPASRYATQPLCMACGTGHARLLSF